MIGAIIGDIVGSRFEFNNLRTKDFDLFTPECEFTDDSICTIAVADAILKGCDYASSARSWCQKYPHPMGGYGGTFSYWIRCNEPKPYNSFGNGSAMRVSPVGFAFNNKADVLREAIASAQFTHNHPEGIVGAVATAMAILDLRKGNGKRSVSRLLRRFYNNSAGAAKGVFDETCQGTVPVAFRLFLESTSFEDAIRRTMQWGGDSDTLGAIVGGMAEAHYGVPSWIRDAAMEYLTKEMQEVVLNFDRSFESQNINK